MPVSMVKSAHGAKSSSLRRLASIFVGTCGRDNGANRNERIGAQHRRRYRIDMEPINPGIRRQAEEGAEGKTNERGLDSSIQITIGGRGRELSAFTLWGGAKLCGFTQGHLSC